MTNTKAIDPGLSKRNRNMASLARLHLAQEAEVLLNKQINMELSASYTYLSMSAWLTKDSVALHGMAKFFRKMSEEENEHGRRLMDYLIQRGGTLQLESIAAPSVDWKSAINILETTLQMEKDVTSSLYNIATVASQHDDHEMEDFISSEYLRPQMQDIKEIADLITQLNMAGTTGLGLYLFDKNMSS